MCFLKFIKLLIKSSQLVGFTILLYTALQQKDITNLQNWIKNSYLFMFSLIIFLTICIKSLYKIFPFLKDSLKLNFTIFLMAGFSFGDKVFQMENLVSLILIFGAIFFFVFFYLFENNQEEETSKNGNFEKRDYVEIKIDKVKGLDKFKKDKDKDNSIFK